MAPKKPSGGKQSTGSSTGARRSTPLGRRAQEKEEEESELEQQLALLARKEAEILQRQKELQAEERKLRQQQERLGKWNETLNERQGDLEGREVSVARWRHERDEEWVAMQQGQVELHTKKDRHAILIGVNKYRDERIRDNDHAVEDVREVGTVLEQLNFRCEYFHDDLPDAFLPTRNNIVRAITATRQTDEILLVYFAGHVVHGVVTPPRTSAILRFLLPCDTPLEFATDTVLTLDDVMGLMTANTIDINDNPFRRKGLLAVDGSYMGVTHNCRSQGFAALRSTAGASLMVEYKKSQHTLFSVALRKALTGAVNVNGLVPVSALAEYLHEKLVTKRGLGCSEYARCSDAALDFPVANKLLKAKHELVAEKALSKQQRCTFTLTYTVNQDLDVHNPLLVRIVSEKLIDICGPDVSVEVGKMELVGKTEVILEGNVQFARAPEKLRLWREAVHSFAGEPVPFQLVSGESTRQGDEGRLAIVILIETEKEQVINTMRSKFGAMTHFFGHQCIDFRQHIRVHLIGAVREFAILHKVAKRGGLDDALFTFTGLHRAIYRIERLNNVDDEKMARLVLDGVALLIVSTVQNAYTTRRNQALGRVADLPAFEGRVRFFFNDVLRDQPLPPVQLLPGPSIAQYLLTNCVLLLDIAQGRNYVMVPGRSFFQYGFFPDYDLREFCEEYLDGKLDALNHRIAGANNHPKYRLL